MPRRETLTDVKVRALRAAEPGKRYDVWDALVPGLSLRVTDRGRKSWTVVSRLRGKPVRVTLGAYPALGLQTARNRARPTLEAISAGQDPRDRGLSFGAALDLYLAERKTGWGERHDRNVRCALDLHVRPKLGKRWLADVTRGDVATVLARIGQPVNANRVREYVSGFYSWAAERELVEANIVAPISRRTEKSRDRVYTDPEIRAVWNGCDSLGWPYGPLVRFLLVTAQRRGQARDMRWDAIDSERKVWNSPTKAKRLHPVPLSDLALELLEDAPKRGPVVFSVLGEHGITNWSYPTTKLKLVERVPPDFRLHDLRRTAATRMAELGVVPRVIDAVLDHVQGGVSGVYQRYGYLEEMRAALALWARRLREILRAT